MAKPPAPDQKSLVGYTIGRCKLLRICGRGAMGTVYQGKHGGLDIEVAVKVLPPHLANNGNLVERFMREAKLAARLNHINTVRVYDVGEESGYNYLVMEYIEGTDALELVKRHGAQKATIVADIGAGAARALEHAHQNGVIHRDIKPANLMLPNTGGVKVADFGLARALASDSGLTMTGAIMGTPDYMAPEQAQGESVGPAADIYSLGATLYHLFVGRAPFAGASPMAVALQHVTNRIVVPEERVTDAASQELTRLIHELTQKDAGRRPENLSDVVLRLKEIALSNRRTQKLLSEGATLYATAGFKMDAESINRRKAEEARARLDEKGKVESPHLDKLRDAAKRARTGMQGAKPRQPADLPPMPSEMAELTGDMVREARAKARRSSGQLKSLGPDAGKKGTRRQSSPEMSPHREQRPTTNTSSRRNRIVRNPEHEEDAWQAYAAKSFPTFEKKSIMDGSARTVAARDQASSIRSSSEIADGGPPAHDYSKPSQIHGTTVTKRNVGGSIANIIVAVLIICGVAFGVWYFALRDTATHGNSSDDLYIASLTSSRFQAHPRGDGILAIAPNPADGTYFTGSESGLLIHWDESGEVAAVRRQLDREFGAVTAIELRPDGSRLAVGTGNGYVMLLKPQDLSTARTQEMRVNGAVTALATIGVTGLVVGDDRGRVSLSGARERVQVDSDGAPVTGVVYRDGEVWAGAGASVGRYQISHGELVELAVFGDLPGEVTALVATEYSVFAMVGRNVYELLATGPGRRSFEAETEVLGVAGNGRHLFTIGSRGITVLDPADLTVLRSTETEAPEHVISAGASGQQGMFYFGTSNGELYACAFR